MLGEWTASIAQIRKDFAESGPVKFVVIKNFFTEEWANKIHEDFPTPDATWKKFDDPIETRYTLWDFKAIPSVVESVKGVHSPAFVKYIEEITSYENILIDPNYEHGSGLQAMPRGGKLGIHLDYNINKQSGKQRRCNLLVYMNKDWKEEYGGALQVGPSVDSLKDIVAPAWNTAIILENSNISYHGVPQQLKCPEGEYRKSIAVYYSSDPLENAEMRYRAAWFPDPIHGSNSKLKNLYDIRSTRAITTEDLVDWPTWRDDII